MLWTEMELRVLGPLELLIEARLATPRPAKVRALLAVLAVHPNEVMASEVLVDALWDGDHLRRPRRSCEGTSRRCGNCGDALADFRYE